MADRDDKREQLPEARVVDCDAGERVKDPMRAVRIGGFVFALLLGWVFILYNNKFDPTPPVVFVCLGYLALLSGIYAMWRTGAVVADEREDDADSTWVRPVGARGELEREKKSLLKAIKETEFDREMGKLSNADADEMITVYRSRAIEVIKELDALGGGEGTVREQILREVRARLELDPKTRAPEGKKKKVPMPERGATQKSDNNAAAATEPTKPETDAEANAEGAAS
jgi:hypothetical protein